MYVAVLSRNADLKRKSRLMVVGESDDLDMLFEQAFTIKWHGDVKIYSLDDLQIHAMIYEGGTGYRYYPRLGKFVQVMLPRTLV
jgi:hypothetical protein